VIDYQAGKRCYSTERLIRWNQTGPRGLTGARGPVGPTGPAGTSAPVRAGVCSLTVSDEFTDSWSTRCTFSTPFTSGTPIVTISPITYGFDPRGAIMKDSQAFVDYSVPPTTTGFTLTMSLVVPSMDGGAGGKFDFTYIAVVSP